jgi:CelD/BcsL family acetyltransferase involved in cellulose biosynthesis
MDGGADPAGVWHGGGMKWSFAPAAGFDAHAADWDALHAQGPASPVLSSDFVRPLLTHFGGGRELLATCRSGARVLAMAVVVPAGPARWQTFQPAQAPVGLWLQAPGQEVALLAASLTRDLPGLAVLMGVTQCDPEIIPRPADGGAAETLDYIETARISVQGSFDDYWQARGKNLRANLKKQRARLERDGVAPRLEVVRDAASVAAAVADYGRLETAGWKAGGGTAVGDNAQGRFYRAMLEAFCRRGAGSIYRYWFDGQLVATDLCVEGTGVIVVLKTTYDESVASALSPTLLMREEACRQLFGEGRFERIEFYGKVMEWHLRWTDEVRTLYHLNTYRWPVLRELRRRLQSRAAP